MPDMAGSPLEGLRVLDLSRVLAGPWATQMLGDLGASVIKVEHPGRRDDTRLWGPPFVGEAEDADAAYYLCANRNKQAIAVDFSQPDGAAVIRALVQQSDILVENFKTGGLARYGLDYDSLSALNPSLIYCSVTGFGQTGPYTGRGGYDFLIQAMSGLMSVTGAPDAASGGPTKVGVPVADLFTGVYAVVSIMAALRHRDKTGEGQHIDCALLDCQLAVMANQGMNYLVGDQVPGRLGNAHPNVVPYRDFLTSDGHIVVAVGNSEQFRGFCKLLGLGAMADDARFATNRDRLANRALLEEMLQAAILGWTSEDLLAEMAVRSIPGGPINTIAQVLDDPHVAARGLIQTLTRDDETEIRVIGYPGRFSRSAIATGRAPPRYGQDTNAVLADLLSLPAVTIDRLRENGIIA